MVSSSTNPTGPSDGPVTPGARALAEHRQILELVARLESGPLFSELAETLSVLSALLVTHFASEEAAGGLFDKLAAAQPNSSSRVEQLRTQHRRLSAKVAELAEEAAGLQQRMDGLFEGASGLAVKLRRHEATESRYLVDTLYIDYGGSG